MKLNILLRVFVTFGANSVYRKLDNFDTFDLNLATKTTMEGQKSGTKSKIS
jgi:hypothetical protein